jgi:hypothetical protein
MLTIPRRARSRARRHWPRILILVVILTFIVVMTVLGCAPVAALGIASAAVAVAGVPDDAYRPALLGARPGAQ